MIDDHDTNDAPEALLKAARRQPRPRKGCREAEARRLHEAGCKVVRLYGRRGELSGLTSQHGGLQVSRYMTASGVVIDVWPITGLDGPGRPPLCSNKLEFGHSGGKAGRLGEPFQQPTRDFGDLAVIRGGR